MRVRRGRSARRPADCSPNLRRARSWAARLCASTTAAAGMNATAARAPCASARESGTETEEGSAASEAAAASSIAAAAGASTWWLPAASRPLLAAAASVCPIPTAALAAWLQVGAGTLTAVAVARPLRAGTALVAAVGRAGLRVRSQAGTPATEAAKAQARAHAWAGTARPQTGRRLVMGCGASGRRTMSHGHLWCAEVRQKHF